ncbi:MAG: DUF4157 domain-containing protein [Paracoccus aminovorans]|nr:DUF4157 domain-containing protein [Paracoccus aminovorans]
MSAARRHAPQTAPDSKAEAKRPRWKVVAKPAEPEAAHIPLERLRAAMAPGVQRAALPFRPALEALFGRDLPQVAVLTGPGVEAALDRAGAEAAARDGLLFLRRDAALPVVAHELAHALQPRRAQADPGAAEAEAGRLEWRAARAAPLPQPVVPLPPGATAFRMQGVLAEPREPAPAPAPAPSAAVDTAPPAPMTPTPMTPAPEPAAVPQMPAEAPQSSAPAALPDLAAQTEAQAAEAQAAMAALDAAADAPAVLAAFRAAPPSVKAREAAGLDARIAAASDRARAAETAALPAFRAEMSPGEALPAAPPVTAPAATPQPLEAAPPRPAPLPTLAPTPDPGPAAANAGLAPGLARDFTVGEPAALRQSLRAVQTSDGAARPLAGPAPAVPLAGATDPARVAEQQDAAAARAGASQAEAARAVIRGPGPERAQLRALSETLTPPPQAAVQPAPAQPPVAGAAGFAAQPLDAETVALFDRAHGPAMQQSLAGAEADLDRAGEARAAGRDAAIGEAEAGTARLNAEADSAQQGEVVARRAEIQGARQQALDRQADEVALLRDEAAAARGSARAGVDAEVGRTETRIAGDFARAEAEARAEVAAGEARAGASRDAAQREAEDQGWWDRALDWVKAQLARLTEAINAIFDAVRAAVRDIIAAAKSAALALIDAAAGLIKAIIDAFGAVLKTLVTRLLAEHFPAIAAALNAAIDAAVNAANTAIDRIAAGLKAGIALLMQALSAALDAVLAARQAATNAALALANAALQGDWRALARLILTPVLMALGIPPDAFFQLFDRAAQAIDLIVANPGGFVQNLLDAVKGGIRRFADNFRRHLIAGIILWLTGPLGRGIVMPAEFDLWGLLDVTRQALGLTLETVRRVAVRVIGEGAVRKIEYVLGYVRALITGGWQGLWEQITSDLGMLRDMVLDQIKTFLLEKVVIAAIMWLASMFNPVGALVKLVLTIWNFIKFLRAQLSKIFAVAQTVINTLWEIATGALEPPIRGVEQVLGRMVPIVLDLLARLIGVDGIPQKVQDILKAVRLRIETALEQLMRRVLAAFGIKTKQPEGPAAGQIMAPIPFRAGAESHTLLIEDEGETVRPVIRSDPTPLVAWLDGRLGQPFTDYAAQKNWRGVVLANKRAELAELVASAKAEEAQLDAQAEATEDAINAAADPNALDALKAAASAKAQDTQAKGEQTKSAVARVLEFFGISIVALDQKFAPELEAMGSALSENLRRQVLPNLDAARYTPLDWGGFATMLAGDGAATEPWRSPANASGAARRFTGGGFDAAVAAEAFRLAKSGNMANADTFLGTAPAFEPERVNALFGDHLARRLNASGANTAIVAQLLAGGGPSYPVLMGAIATPLLEAVTAMCAGGTDAYDHAFDRVTGSYFKSVIVDQFDTVMTEGSWGTYYQDDAKNAAGSGEGGVSRPLGYFVRPDPTGNAGSKRAGKNGQRLADAVRGADPGQHEWIASRFAAQIIRNAAADVERGQTDRLRGLCELIQFQHRVRTPTKQLIFAPEGPYPAQKVVISYQAYGHRMDPDWQATPEAALPAPRRAAWYPPGAPHQGTRIAIMQGHPGAIYARVSASAPSAEIKPQTVGHGFWDQALEGVVARDLSDGSVYFNEMHQLADNIVRFFRLTVWDGESLPEGGTAYGEYFNSGAQAESLLALAADYRGYFPNFEATLQAQVDQVRSA